MRYRQVALQESINAAFPAGVFFCFFRLSQDNQSNVSVCGQCITHSACASIRVEIFVNTSALKLGIGFWANHSFNLAIVTASGACVLQHTKQPYSRPEGASFEV